MSIAQIRQQIEAFVKNRDQLSDQSSAKMFRVTHYAPKGETSICHNRAWDTLKTESPGEVTCHYCVRRMNRND